MNAYGVVAEFEARVAKYADSRYAVAVDCCTSAIFLCLQYVKTCTAYDGGPIVLPARTYVSVPMACIHAGFSVRFEDYRWEGIYKLNPHEIWDGAKRFTKYMYQGGLHCLSFHTKKIIDIGRGGMILTDSHQAATWLRKARYDGREGLPYPQEKIEMMGWHCYMQPDAAARGMMLLDVLPEHNADQTEDYPDLRTFPVFAQKMALAA